MGAALVLFGSGLIPVGPAGGAPSTTGATRCVAALRIGNVTSLLGPTFQPGAPQTFGANGSAVVVGGIGVYVKQRSFTLPVFASLEGNPPAAPAKNLTAQIDPYFHDGGVYAAVWNGTAWLLGGQATWNGTTSAALVAWKNGVFTNLSGLIANSFVNGSSPRPPSKGDWGVWALAWNGTAWLVGGNGSRGATLLSFRGTTVTDLSPQLASSRGSGWILLLAWNGTTWLIGGYHVLEAYAAGVFVDYLPTSPFAGSGAFGADWNGTAWLIGGGPPAALATLRDGTLRPGPAPPASFNGAWVGPIIALNASTWDVSCTGWLLAGLGSLPTGFLRPALGVWLPADSASPVDLSSRLPQSFDRGLVQFAGWAPPFGRGAILLAGQGGLNATTGASVGALGEVVLGPPNGS